MIPKKIHYCWFGEKELPKAATKCISSWGKQCPDYKIYQWDECNIDLKECPQYVQDAYQAGKYAYVTDYVRLKVLIDHGGFYMDTDVELLRSPEELLKNQAVIGFENNSFVNSGQMLASEAGHPVLEEMLHRYDDLKFYKPDGSMNLVGCPHINTEVLALHGMELNGREQTVAGVHIYPADWFNPFDSVTGILTKTKNTISVHWYSMSWLSPARRLRVKIMRLVRRMLRRS